MNEFALEISELIGLVKGPFPYQDCYTIQAIHPRIARDIIPDLDMFFYDTSAVAEAAGDRHFDASRLRELRKYVAKSFLARHPNYLKAIVKVTPELTPKLHAWLEIHERLRQINLAILDDLEFAGSKRARSSG